MTPYARSALFALLAASLLSVACSGSDKAPGTAAAAPA